MIFTSTKRRPVEVPESIQCNACGRSWSLKESPHFEAQEVEEFQVMGGYGNHQWGDLIQLRWHACQDCVAAWIEGFVVPPEAFEISPALGSKPRPIPFKFYGRD